MRLKLAVIIACFLGYTDLLAQYTDSTSYYAGYISTGSYNRTNSSSAYLLNNGIKLGARKKDLALNSSNKWLYGQQNNVLTNNDVLSAWDLNLYKTFPHFYYWGLFNYNTSYSLKINHQLQAGIGVAYNFFDTKKITINLSDGIIYDYSDIILSDGVRNIYATPRNSFRLQVKSNIKDRFAFNGNAFLQNSLEDSEDYIIKSDISLSVKLKKWLSITSAFSYNEMSRTQKSNLIFTYGFTIEKYF
jgi:hypothetical protein